MIRQRTSKRVVWDGPHPAPRDFLAMQHGRDLWRIQAITINRASAGGDDGTLTLDLTRHHGPLPAGAVVHPGARLLPSDPAGPPRVRQLASGPTAVMKANWRDPTDLAPNASKRPRELRGYRTYCPLRRMMQRPGSQVTDKHLAAADLLRVQVDMAVIGCSGSREGINAAYGPRRGPSDVAVSQVAATISARRALARLSEAGRAMTQAIILHNISLHVWCLLETERRGRGADPDVELGRLLGVLDVLAEHYSTEAGQALASAAG
jgi:hypothetical protein